MQQIARSVALAFNNLPRPHRVMLGSLTVLTLAVAVWRPYVYHRDATPIVKTIELEQNEIRSLLPEASEPIDQAAQEDEAIPQDELDDKIAGEAGVHEYVVSTGDTLSSILNQYGIDMGDITQLAAADKELRNLKIGQQLSWTLTADGELQRLTWEVSRRETRTYDRTAANGFKMTSEMQQGEWVNNLLKGTVGGSFVASARNAGLTSAEVSAVIKAMQWQMDFRKLKKGDEFAVLMSEKCLMVNVSKASCWAYVCVQKVKIITQSALKMANSTIVTVLVWRKDSCDSRRRNSSVSHLTLTRVVLIR